METTTTPEELRHLIPPGSSASRKDNDGEQQQGSALLSSATAVRPVTATNERTPLIVHSSISMSPNMGGSGRRRAWSHCDVTPLVPTVASSTDADSETASFLGSPRLSFLPTINKSAASGAGAAAGGGNNKSKAVYLYYVIYALVNVIISVPGLYGYAAVIFNHPVFANHMNALSKLVIFSSLMMQLSFTLFSSMPFAIGTVQDAGLIFLSSMSNAIANKMMNDGETDTKAIVSTTMVLLSAGTALLGIVLIVIGKFKLANVVSYLPMPVVGGYLAFIGYFCVQAGTALCISQPLVTFADWAYLFNWENLLLALPGLLAALLLTWISRTASNDAYLPLSMVAIPALFYIIVYATGAGLEGAREKNWVGDVAPPVPVTDLFSLVDFTLVRWDCVYEIIWTWVGMVFVVSFASCLDVAAIAMDKGEALDTNHELATVGIGNLMSGLTFGFTGSYIFSQTIFTYRTGVHSRWIGILIMVVFMYIVVSPVNILQVAPLFFLGSTLIFIGYDLLYEWLIEIRPRVLLSEYGIIWGTFIAIQIVGVDFGIVVGVLVAILDNVVVTAQTTTVTRVLKRSRAVWSQSENQILQNYGYHPTAPKIATFEINGPVFFGSSLAILDSLVEEVGLDDVNGGDELAGSDLTSPIRSPHTSSHLLMNNLTRRHSTAHSKKGQNKRSTTARRSPQFCVIDLSLVTNMDASAARTCFLQFTNLCKKKEIVVCAACATPKMDWMLRTHGVSYTLEEEGEVKARIQKGDDSSRGRRQQPKLDCEKILLFLTIHEALEFCENALIHQFPASRPEQAPSVSGLALAGPQPLTLSGVFARILDCSPAECIDLSRLDGLRYHDVIQYSTGERVFAKGSLPAGFYVVLLGTVASEVDSKGGATRNKNILTGAGTYMQKAGSQSDLLDPEFHDSERVATLWPVCGVFGYSDFLLERPHIFGAIACQNATRVARMDRSQMNLLASDPALSALVHKALLQASIRDLQNCTCRDV